MENAEPARSGPDRGCRMGRSRDLEALLRGEPVDDELVRRFVDRALKMEVELLDEPHIVVCGQAGPRAVHIGPYPNGYEAMAGFLAHGATHHVDDGRRGAPCTIEPLFAG